MSSARANRPALLLDVDGVLIPFGRIDAQALVYPTLGTQDDYIRHDPSLPEWLAELSTEFELVWATSWELAANETLSPVLGLPQLRTILFADEVGVGENYKLPGVQRFVGDRPFAWVDDVICEGAKAWVDLRIAPGLLLEVKPDTGMTRDHVDKLLGFADRCKGVRR